MREKEKEKNRNLVVHFSQVKDLKNGKRRMVHDI